VLFDSKLKSVRPTSKPRLGRRKEMQSFEESDDSLLDVSGDEGHRRDDAELAELENQDKIEKGDFVLVRFDGKKSAAHYVGQVTECNGDSMATMFMRRSDMHKGSVMTFSFNGDDASSHAREDIVLKLPKPMMGGGTKRCASKHIFSCDLTMYDPL
jgi:hypothetical protein